MAKKKRARRAKTGADPDRAEGPMKPGPKRSPALVPSAAEFHKRARAAEVKERASGSPLARGLKSTGEYGGIDPRARPGDPASREEPRRRRLGTLGGLLLGLAVVLAGGGLYLLLKPAAISIIRDDKLNVLLITLDTTRADHIGAYGYAKARTPNLDALARNGVRFENAYAPVPLTLASHASIMTGTTPLIHNIHNNGATTFAAELPTLAGILKDKGLKTAAFVASFSVDSRFGLDKGFDIYDDNFQEGTPFKAMNAERKAEQVFKVFGSWFDKVAGEQFFGWLHFFDPHLPYNPPATLREQFADLPYDGEIAYMDNIIGLVMAKLRDKNLFGKTLIIVAGDHGEAFGEKGEAGHGVFLYDMVLRVPLIFYAEGHLPATKTVSPRVRLIDILPTILDLMNLPSPASVEGTSLIPYIQKKQTRDLETYIETYYPKENFGWTPFVGLISENWKYIRAPKQELYDLKADPGEAKNAVAGRAKTAAGLKERLDAIIRTAVVPGVTAKQALTPQEQAKLRSLGYVDYTDPTARGEAPDPKDRLEELKMIQDAEKFEFEGNFKAAAELHEKMLSLRPGAASSYINLALAQARQKDFDAAVATLKRGIAKISNSELLLSRLGYTYLVMSRLPDALEVMADVLKLNPRSVDALTATSVILDGTGRKDEARAYFEKALAVEPENKFLRSSYAQNLASAGRVAEAIEIFTKLTRDFPQDPQPYQYLGMTYALLKDFDKAIDNLKQVIYIKPTPPAYYYLAMACKEKGENAEAVRYLERYLEDTKGEPEARVKNAQKGLDFLRNLK